MTRERELTSDPPRLQECQRAADGRCGLYVNLYGVFYTPEKATAEVTELEEALI